MVRMYHKVKPHYIVPQCNTLRVRCTWIYNYIVRVYVCVTFIFLDVKVTPCKLNVGTPSNHIIFNISVCCIVLLTVNCKFSLLHAPAFSIFELDPWFTKRHKSCVLGCRLIIQPKRIGCSQFLAISFQVHTAWHGARTRLTGGWPELGSCHAVALKDNEAHLLLSLEPLHCPSPLYIDSTMLIVMCNIVTLGNILVIRSCGEGNSRSGMWESTASKNPCEVENFVPFCPFPSFLPYHGNRIRTKNE